MKGIIYKIRKKYGKFYVRNLINFYTYRLLYFKEKAVLKKFWYKVRYIIYGLLLLKRHKTIVNQLIALMPLIVVFEILRIYSVIFGEMFDEVFEEVHSNEL